MMEVLADAMIVITLQYQCDAVSHCIKSTHYTPETHTMFYVNYISMKLGKQKEKVENLDSTLNNSMS